MLVKIYPMIKVIKSKQQIKTEAAQRAKQVERSERAKELAKNLSKEGKVSKKVLNLIKKYA